MRDDEKRLLVAVRESGWPHTGKTNPFRIACVMGIPPKRALYLLQKWSDKGWVEVGTCLEWAWLLPAGEAVADELGATQSR